MSAFDDCLNFVLAEEGPPSDDPKDPGGRTAKGVTQRVYDAWRNKQGLPQQDVWLITVTEAGELYREQYWNATHCDALDKPVALCVFDSAVNMGCKEAIELLQTAIGAVVDGIFGPETLRRYEVAAQNMPLLLSTFHDARVSAYEAKPNFLRYGHGWVNRSDSCERLALSWIGASNGDT